MAGVRTASELGLDRGVGVVVDTSVSSLMKMGSASRGAREGRLRSRACRATSFRSQEVRSAAIPRSTQPARRRQRPAPASPKPAHQMGAGNAGERVGQAFVARRLPGLHTRQAVQARRQSVEP